MEFRGQISKSLLATIPHFQGGRFESKASYRYDTHHVMSYSVIANICSLQISKNNYHQKGISEWYLDILS